QKTLGISLKHLVNEICKVKITFRETFDCMRFEGNFNTIVRLTQ
ncbi:26931_t:CDS:1, partial [Racocetra persica]